MTPEELKPYEITSLRPGFIVITYREDLIFSRHIVIAPEEWVKLVEKGYSGGIIVPEGVTFDSLDDALMNDLGWERIKR